MMTASTTTVERYHVTVLSNLIRGYDKYSHRYSKCQIPESTYPDQFFLLKKSDLSIGLRKADALLTRLKYPDDCLIVLKTILNPEKLYPNLRTGKGEFIKGNSVHVDEIYRVDADDQLHPILMEEACARSLATLYGIERDYENTTPRSISILPIAMGCQAACKFCFSKASVSADQLQGDLDTPKIKEALHSAKQRGAERAVITGGGEPGMLPFEKLEALVKLCASYFHKVVLITNGYRWAKLSENERLIALKNLQDAGLTIMAISRHHHDQSRNAAIMSLETGSERVAHTWKSHRDVLTELKLRWICVLQKNGIDDQKSLNAYLDWAAETEVTDVCFKELYISTSEESEYHDYPANRWSREHQIPLNLITNTAQENGWRESFRLPWGAPIYETTRKGNPLRVAAYTEPSLYWELTNGLCRSWNLMTDGRCLASLEDQQSNILLK